MSVPTQSVVTFYPGYSQQVVAENLIVRQIESISNSFPMIVTTTVDHKYVAGMKVRFLIPSMFKMVELNNLDGQVLDLTNNQLAIDIDSSNFSVFSYPDPIPSSYVTPSIVPNSSGPYLPPKPLPFGNQQSFEGVFFNNGIPANPINGI